MVVSEAIISQKSLQYKAHSSHTYTSLPLLLFNLLKNKINDYEISDSIYLMLVFFPIDAILFLLITSVFILISWRHFSLCKSLDTSFLQQGKWIRAHFISANMEQCACHLQMVLEPIALAQWTASVTDHLSCPRTFVGRTEGTTKMSANCGRNLATTNAVFSWSTPDYAVSFFFICFFLSPSRLSQIDNKRDKQ